MPKAAGGKKILIVEDERPVARALELKLHHSGFDVKVAYDGEEALKIATDEDFDLILLDLILPKMNGFEILETLKKKGKKANVIVTSNLGQEEDEKKARDLGAKGYFVKSNTSLSELVQHVQEAIK
ncbi:MAG: response regulator [Candidatus Magasanikbacteria bacterium]|nr:response regulator [Candidatus Magasanikbacteria bacterium]